jgi:hypothetical protein
MSCARTTPLALLVMVCAAGPVAACTAPERPFLPQSQDDMRTYADLIRSDFAAYIADVQEYLRCLDAERVRAFVEAREASEDYARLLRALE